MSEPSSLPEEAVALAGDPPALVRHIVERYHAPVRDEFARLLALAERVETHHGDLPECPLGIGLVLGDLYNELSEHLDREEREVFPLIAAGHAEAARRPGAAMRAEHADWASRFAAIRELTHGFTPPDFACRTWRGLYEGLEKLERDLDAHMRIEDELLFGG